MKNTTIILSLLLSVSVATADELSWVNKQVEAIKPERKGLDFRILKKIKSPFIFLKKNRVTVKKEAPQASRRSVSVVSKQQSKSYCKPPVKHVSGVLVLNATMNNSVMINGKWYKLGDRVSGYKIKSINGNSVVLANSEKKILLSTKSRSNKIKFLK